MATITYGDKIQVDFLQPSTPISSSYEQWERQAREAGQSGDWALARSAWEHALEALPAGSPERELVEARIRNIELQSAPERVTDLEAPLLPPGTRWRPPLERQNRRFPYPGKRQIAPARINEDEHAAQYAGLLRRLLRALWLEFAVGLVLSIYVHEMGHVYWLRRYGIAATAPMFIPGFGAFIRLKAYPASAGEDARAGLAGPLWGLGAALFAWGAGLLTGAPVWFALARTGAWINLFNLLPVWQLDGGRGFRALNRPQRLSAFAAAVGFWIFTGQTILLLISLGALYRVFSKDYAARPDSGVLLQYAGLIAALSLLLARI